MRRWLSALHYIIFMVRKEDNRVGIGAKALSGEGYKGHSFWDTETFIFPYFQMAEPEVARTLLEFRYKGLYGARKKAKENGYKGAMYPWEAAWISDGEVTPYITGVNVHTGEPLICLTGVIERMRFLFSPMISGVVIFMVGVSLSGFTLSEFLGGAPGDKTFADPHILTVSILTTAIVLVLSLLGKGLLKSFSFLIALVVGTVVAAAFGMVDFSPVASKGWLGLPTFLPYGPFTFDWKIFIPFFIAYMVAVMEALGVYQAASEIQGTPLERKQVRYGLAGEAAGSAISSLIGGFTTTAYPQNVGLLNLTGEGKLRTRTPVIIAAVLLLILGFVPKAGALLSVIPSAVVGGIFLPAAASLIVTGLRALRKVADDERRQTVIGMSLLLGIALPKALSGLTGGASVFFGNNIMVGVFSAIILNALFVALPDLVAKHRAPASVDVPAADPADGTGAAAYDER